jgi:ribose transport system substrate-binding protein
MKYFRLRAVRLFAALLALSLIAAACGGDDDEGYVIGVSNTLVGNGWREQMICAIEAQALASGEVAEVIVVNENGGPTEQIEHIDRLISQGVDAIILNPTSTDGLNDAIKAATDQDIVVVAIDQVVSSTDAYNVANDQYQYGKVGAEWLFNQLGGTGKVVEMRGIDGVPADTDRHNGFLDALANFPGIEVVAETFTGWDPTVGAQQALELMTANPDIDGIWTSGIDYTVVNALQTANIPLVPIVGADNNGFLAQLINDGVVGAAITNPPAIGGAGVGVAIAALNGDNPSKSVALDIQVLDMAANADLVRATYNADIPVGSSAYVHIAPWTSYTDAQVFGCEKIGSGA